MCVEQRPKRLFCGLGFTPMLILKRYRWHSPEAIENGQGMLDRHRSNSQLADPRAATRPVSSPFQSRTP
jgi:hypothetical protein